MPLLTKLYQNAVLIPVSKKLKDKEFELPYVNAKDKSDYQISKVNKAKVQMEFLLSSLKSLPILLIVILQILSIRIFLIISIRKC